jgi:hypothetical protein
MREINYNPLYERFKGDSWVEILVELEEANNRGEEVVAHIHKHTFYSKDFNFEEAYGILIEIEEIKAIAGESWVPVLDQIEKAKEEGREVFACINGHVFYSIDFDINEAYIKLTGAPKPRDKKYALDHLGYWYDRGQKLIYPERMIEWRNMVNTQALNGYDYGKKIDWALELMEMLERGCTVEEVHKAMDDLNLSGSSYMFLCRVILFFSKRGPEFVQINPGKQDYDYYLRIVNENKEYEEAERKRNEEVPNGGVPGKK